MKFDTQKQGLEEKLASLTGLQSVLRDLEANQTNVSEEPAERVVLPYEGQRALRTEKWKKTTSSQTHPLT